LNQIEIWLSILVRTLLKRGLFTSVEDLQAGVCAFLDSSNRTMAKAFTIETMDVATPLCTSNFNLLLNEYQY
jgi:hypothetical protein